MMGRGLHAIVSKVWKLTSLADACEAPLENFSSHQLVEHEVQFANRLDVPSHYASLISIPLEPTEGS